MTAGRTAASDPRTTLDAETEVEAERRLDAEPRLDGVAAPTRVVPGSLGVLGGTFDPIHHGHLLIAEEARETLGLERVLLVPAASPPHKPGRPISDARHRLAMLELAIAGNRSFEAGRLELARGGTSYTVDTLLALRTERGPGADDPWLVLSAEALAELPTWREPDRILELSRLAVVPRGGFAVLDGGWVTRHFPGREERVRFLAGPLLPISGSVVRRRAAAGRSVRYLVPEDVARYIAEHRLYTGTAWRTDAT
jgi:nicotinate-nucleotide adenylyltransferase